MKFNKKILSALLISGCFLTQQSAYAAPFNAYVGASTGFQRGLGALNGRTFLDDGFGGVSDIPYGGRINKNDFVGDLFFEVDKKVSDYFHIGLRPYFHVNNFKSAFKRDVSQDNINPGQVQTAQFTLQRQHAFGMLLAPKIPFKEITLYGLFGAEFTRFKSRIDKVDALGGVLNDPVNFSKGSSSLAAVIGLGLSKEFGNWSLFAEGQYKHYKTKQILNSANEGGVLTSQSLKFSPKFASIMFGVKFKFI